MKARYIRVSTINQKIERQLLKQHSAEKLYIDKVSGSIPFAQRPQAKALLKDISLGVINYIVVSSIDRLGRNTLGYHAKVKMADGTWIRVDEFYDDIKKKLLK